MKWIKKVKAGSFLGGLEMKLFSPQILFPTPSIESLHEMIKHGEKREKAQYGACYNLSDEFTYINKKWSAKLFSKIQWRLSNKMLSEYPIKTTYLGWALLETESVYFENFILFCPNKLCVWVAFLLILN